MHFDHLCKTECQKHWEIIPKCVPVVLFFLHCKRNARKNTLAFTPSTNVVRICPWSPPNVVWSIRLQCILVVFTPGFSCGQCCSIVIRSPNARCKRDLWVVVSDYNMWCLIWCLCWDSTIITQYKWNILLSSDLLSHAVKDQRPKMWMSKCSTILPQQLPWSDF